MADMMRREIEALDNDPDYIPIWERLSPVQIEALKMIRHGRKTWIRKGHIMLGAITVVVALIAIVGMVWLLMR